MKLAGFLILLAVVFVAARLVSAQFEPVTTSHSHVVYTGGADGADPGGTSSGMNAGMNMGTRP